jgi:hypothetical protein
MPIKTVNSTMVAVNVGREVGNLLLWYDGPLSAFLELRDALADEGNYQSEIVLAPTRQYEPLLNGQPSRILSAAGKDVDYPSGIVGQPVANPQDEGEFADAFLERILRDKIIAWKFNAAQESSSGPESIPTPVAGS